ncbi:MAG TPA: hypothetical protein PKN95_06790 [Verrucomicrobiota bacterium]|nr:hypothetical protein [Verrucomicrobiota bacterium]HNT14746.1 hypothetical protein [Verrucomicrobiota bacterium]
MKIKICGLTNVAGAWRSEFKYDAFGRRRVRREYTWQSSAWVKTNEVRHVYDGLLTVQERDANNLAMVSYTRGNDLSGTRQGAGGIGGLLARTDHSALHTPQSALAHAYYHCDESSNMTAPQGDASHKSWPLNEPGLALNGFWLPRTRAEGVRRRTAPAERRQTGCFSRHNSLPPAAMGDPGFVSGDSSDLHLEFRFAMNLRGVRIPSGVSHKWREGSDTFQTLAHESKCLNGDARLETILSHEPGGKPVGHPPRGAALPPLNFG